MTLHLRGLLLGVALICPVGVAHGETIDDFSEGDWGGNDILFSGDSGGDSLTSASSFLASPSATRDASVTAGGDWRVPLRNSVTGLGGADNTFQAEVNTPGSTLVLDYNTFGSANLAPTGDTFTVNFDTSTDTGGTFDILVEDGSGGSDSVDNTSFGTGAQSVDVAFGSFTGVDFTDVTRLVFTFDATTAGHRFRVSSLETTGSATPIPLPPAFPAGLLLLGAIGVRGVVRRKTPAHD